MEVRDLTWTVGTRRPFQLAFAEDNHRWNDACARQQRASDLPTNGRRGSLARAGRLTHFGCKVTGHHGELDFPLSNLLVKVRD